MHTKKTNNTNKLIQISYHYILTKIQKLQNFKKKKKTFFCTGWYARYRSVLLEIGRYGRYGRYFFGYEIGGVERTGLLVGTVYSSRTGRYGTKLTTLLFVLVTIYPKWKTKIKLRSSYPKTLNSEARLWNGKVLGTNSAQTKSSLLDSHVPLYAWYEWYIAYMKHLSHISLFMNVSSSFLKI